MSIKDNKNELHRKARTNVGKLLYLLIKGDITAFEATKYFPKNIDDISLKIAWHALLHYDADEEIRLKDYLYAQEQIKFIETLANILSKGEELPHDMLIDYEKIYQTTILPKQYNWLGKIKAFFRFTN